MKKHCIYLILMLLVSSCSQKQNNKNNVPQRKTCNAVYYWKTTFRLSDEERQFIENHKIEKLYLRYFDVYRSADFQWKTVPVPEATILFIDSVPQNLEVIPTVFIDNQLFVDCDMLPIAEKLVNRILTMTETNNVPNIREVQIDCDWTQSTETVFFDFLQMVGNLFAEHNIEVSATIRLHQLRTKAPPVVRGVLMCYNTGGVRSPQTTNSILSAKDVAMYAGSMKNYALPLDMAYPTFSWAVWFSDGKFQALLRSLTTDNENITQIKDNVYRVKEGFYCDGKFLAKDDEVRFETSDFEEIMKAKSLLEKDLKNYSVIIYHLDYKNLQKYSEDEIHKIFAH